MLELATLKRLTICWMPDPFREFWLQATLAEGTRYIRVNRFPDEPLYSLDLGDGVFEEFNDFPRTWQRAPLIWPSSAEARWPADPDE